MQLRRKWKSLASWPSRWYVLFFTIMAISLAVEVFPEAPPRCAPIGAGAFADFQALSP